MSIPLLIPRVPNPLDPTNAERLRRALDRMTDVLNALLLSGDIVQTGGTSFQIVGAGTGSSSTPSGLGSPGPPGAPGSQWYPISSEPPSPLLGALGDLAFNAVSGNLYRKQKAAEFYPPRWVLLGNLKGGPIGPAGPAGPPGPAGPAGVGSVGPAGPAGSSALSTVIGTQTLGSNTATVTFSSIPATYSHLRLTLVGRGAAAALNENIYVRMNGDTGSNYDWEEIQAFGGTLQAAAGNNDSRIQAGDVAAANSDTGATGAHEYTFLYYAQTTFWKSMFTNGFLVRSTSNNEKFNQRYSGVWRSTAAVNQIDLLLASGNWLAGSIFTLYGVP